MDMYQKLMQCYDSVRAKTSFEPKVAVVLGSGLGNYADNIDIVDTVLYRDIENFPVSTAPGHKGCFVFGYVDKVPVVIMQGRVHCYEGYSPQDVVLPIRLMGLLGAKRILLTNAAGACNPDYEAGNFMLIRDHITSFVPSPLIGPNLEKLGPRFPDMSDVYKADLRNSIREEAEKLNLKLREGIYVQLTGPNFETPQEVEFYRSAGADAAGMSTAIEAMAATHMGMEVCGISCISNMGAGLSDLPLTEEEVIETADRVAPLFTVLVTNIIKAIA